MKVSEWIERYGTTAITVTPDTKMDDVIDRLLERPAARDVYVVSPGGRVVGHLSYKKLAMAFLADHRAMHTRRQLMDRVAGGAARDFMDGSFTWAGPDEELDNVLARQLEHDVEDMPVLDDNGALLGMVNLTAVLRELRRGKSH